MFDRIMVESELNTLKKALKNKIEYFINTGELEKAKATINEAESFLGEDDEFLSIKATMLIIEGRPHEAIEVLKQALRINSKNEDVLYNLGYLYKLQGDFAEASIFYAKAFNETKSIELKKQIIGDMKDFDNAPKPEKNGNCAGKRILIGSPVHQDPKILKEFLSSLADLEREDMIFDYFFIDDNAEQVSSELLYQFSVENKNTTIIKSGKADCYFKNDDIHSWTDELVWKVAGFKNLIIERAVEYDYDYLFLVDSDLLLNPKTIKSLISAEKDIISCIFWTKWSKETEPLPQVWVSDFYNQFYHDRNEKLDKKEVDGRRKLFLNIMDTPGIYEIGGLGACTLISRNAMVKGVNFNEIRNITFIGEDRHFCVRAAALGFSLWVDTHYPAYHIYRMGDLDGIADYRMMNHLKNGSAEKYEIVQNIKTGVEGLCSFGTDDEDGDSFDYCFAGDTFDSLLNQHREKRIKEGVTVNKTKVMDLKFITIDVVRGYAEVRIRAVETGYKGSVSTYDEKTYIAKVKKESAERWVIRQLEYEYSDKPVSKPMTRIAKPADNRLTLSMVIKNESGRYLREVLMSLREYIDDAVIIDDGSTDGSGELCKELLQGIPLKLIRNAVSKFSNEIELRKQQWDETIKTNPDWILNLDGDEIFEKDFAKGVRNLINQQDIDVYNFRLYDFWDNDHYREDKYWCAHMTYRTFLLRYQPNFNYTWKETNQHCGRFPNNINQLPYKNSEYRLKHFGWAREEDRISKYNRYMELDPDCKFGWREQYESILDKHPNLVKWVE